MLAPITRNTIIIEKTLRPMEKIAAAFIVKVSKAIAAQKERPQRAAKKITGKSERNKRFIVFCFNVYNSIIMTLITTMLNKIFGVESGENLPALNNVGKPFACLGGGN